MQPEFVSLSSLEAEYRDLEGTILDLENTIDAFKSYGYGGVDKGIECALHYSVTRNREIAETMVGELPTSGDEFAAQLRFLKDFVLCGSAPDDRDICERFVDVLPACFEAIRGDASIA